MIQIWERLTIQAQQDLIAIHVHWTEVFSGTSSKYLKLIYAALSEFSFVLKLIFDRDYIYFSCCVIFVSFFFFFVFFFLLLLLNPLPLTCIFGHLFQFGFGCTYVLLCALANYCDRILNLSFTCICILLFVQFACVFSFVILL